jgi:hypothetical protein
MNMHSLCLRHGQKGIKLLTCKVVCMYFIYFVSCQLSTLLGISYRFKSYTMCCTENKEHVQLFIH